MRTCFSCHHPIDQAAIWNLALPGPVCSVACVSAALPEYGRPLSPARLCRVAVWVSAALVSPATWHALHPRPLSASS